MTLFRVCNFVYSTATRMNYVRCDTDQLLTDLILGSLATNFPRATRVLVSRTDRTTKAGPSPSEVKNREGQVMQPQRGLLGPSRLQNATPDQQKMAATTQLGGSSTPDELMLTTPSMLKNSIDTCGQSVGQNYHQKTQANLLAEREKSSQEPSSQISSHNLLVVESFKKEELNSVVDPQLTSQSKNHFLQYLTTELCACLVISLLCR